MANIVFNQALGAVFEKIRDGANIVIVPIDAGATTDATFKDHDFLNNVLAASTERTTGGWNRKSISNASITATVDDTNDRTAVDIADQTWTAVSLGSVTDLVIAEDFGGVDTTRVPLTLHDFTITPDGSDVTAQVADFYRAA